MESHFFWETQPVTGTGKGPCDRIGGDVFTFHALEQVGGDVNTVKAHFGKNGVFDVVPVHGGVVADGGGVPFRFPAVGQVVFDELFHGHFGGGDFGIFRTDPGGLPVQFIRGNGIDVFADGNVGEGIM